MVVFAYLAAFHIKETEYLNGEEGVIIPKHVLSDHTHESHGSENEPKDAYDEEKRQTPIGEKTPPRKESVLSV